MDGVDSFQPEIAGSAPLLKNTLHPDVSAVCVSFNIWYVATLAGSIVSVNPAII